MITSFNPNIIEGKWNKRSYQIQRELGRGATGVVYLVCFQGKAYALKLGEDTLSITAEVNILKKCHQSGSGILGPAVYDVDDWVEGEKTRPFYVMNVIEGLPLLPFVEQRGVAWVPVLMLQLLDFLEALHQQGFIFGDLKPDNLKVSGHPPRLAWFDPGGITKLGWAVKEYTEIYDRAFWQMGDRKAEPAYDLFSAALIFLFLYTGKTIQPQTNPQEELAAFVFQNKRLGTYQHLLWQALTGKYSSAREMKQELLRLWFSSKNGRKHIQQQKHHQTYQVHSSAPPASKKRKARGHVLERLTTFFFLSSFFIFLFALYLFSQTL